MLVQEPTVALKPPRAFTWPVFLLGISNACFFLVHTGTFATVPIYVTMRGGSESDVALIIGLIGLFSLLTRPFSGLLIDTWGRRRMLALSTLSLVAVAVGLGYSYVVPLIAVFRVIQGTAVGVTNTAAATYASDIAPPGRRGTTIGYVMSIQTTAASIGPTLGYTVLTWSALAGLNDLAFWWPDLRGPAFAGFNFGALFFLMTIVALLGLVTVLQLPEAGSSSGKKMSLQGLIDRRAALPLALVATLAVTMGAALSFMPFLGPERGLSNVGLYFTCQAIGAFGAGLFVGRISDAVGRRPVVLAGLLCSGLSAIVISVAGSALVLLACGLLNGLANSSCRNALAAWTADRVPPAERGSALSTLGMGFDIGIAVAAPALGFVVSQYGFPPAFVFAGAATLVGGLVAFFLLHDIKRPAAGAIAG